MPRQFARSLVAAAVVLCAASAFAQVGAPVVSADYGVAQAGYGGASCQKGCGQKGSGCGALQRGCNSCCPGCCVDWCPYGRWCGHGKNIGWTFRCGDGLMPKGDAWLGHRHGWGAMYAPCAGGCGGGCCGHGGCGCFAPWGYRGPSNMYEGHNADLFYNYYAPQGSSEGVPTDMYASPQDTPYPAIQTYYTYQPWLPHEYLYNHNRTYTRYYSGGMGRNTTRVTWGGSPIQRTHAQGLVW